MCSRILSAILVFGSLFTSTGAFAVTNVLFLGDSLSADEAAGLGRNLSLPADRFKLKVDAFCGYSPDNFTNATALGKMDTPCGAYTRDENGATEKNETGTGGTQITLKPLSQLMTFQSGSGIADWVVIQLGTNLYDNVIDDAKHRTSTGRKEVLRQAKRLLSTVLTLNPNAKIIWLAPPKIWSYEYGEKSVPVRISSKMSDQMFITLQKSASSINPAQFTLLDSREFTDYPPHTEGYDGTHFSTLQRAWLEKTESLLQ